MGYYEATGEIRIVWVLVPTEYHWRAIFIEKRTDWFTQAVDNCYRLEIVVSARKLQQLFGERVLSTLQFSIFMASHGQHLLVLLDIFS